MICKREPFINTSKCSQTCAYLLIMDEKSNVPNNYNNKISFVVLTSFLCTLIFLIIMAPLSVRFFVDIPQNTGDVCMDAVSINSPKIDSSDILSHISEFYSTIIVVLTTLLALTQIVCYIFIKNSSTKEIESQVSTCLSGEFFKHTLNHCVSEAVVKQFQDEGRKTAIDAWLASSTREEFDNKISELEKRLSSLDHNISSDNTPDEDDKRLLESAKNRMSTQGV